MHASAFERLPDEVGELHRLESLRIISARSLEEPPSTLTKLRRLTTVSIGDWNLPTAPSVLLQMPWLRTVTIFARVLMDPASERALRGALPGCEVSVRYTAGVKG